MAKVRSPAYPAIGLKEAVEAVTKIYNADYQNPIPREIAARHIGYNGLNGKSLGALSALLKYGLLEGRGDETKVSDRAVQIIAYEPGSTQRADALVEAMKSPELFIELDLRFQNGKASDQAIKAYLLTQKFIPSAADHALRSYRETKALVTAESEAYNAKNPEAAFQIEMNERHMQAQEDGFSPFAPAPPARSKAAQTMAETFDQIMPSAVRREVITLDEGDVVITFPEDLSADSFGDLKDHLELFIKKMQRRAKSSSKPISPQQSNMGLIFDDD